MIGRQGDRLTNVEYMSIDATAFSDHWVRDWNAHDVEALLAHFTDDVRFTSPIAARLLPDTGGQVHGKSALRHYWNTALAQFPDLHFTVEAVYSGVDIIVITYRNQLGGLVNEVLQFRDGLVCEGHGTYLVTP